MSQITSGLRSVLSMPVIYSGFQYLMGANNFWKNFVNSLNVKSGDCVLDIGCGPADILMYMPKSVGYWGFDISPEYIDSAKKKHKHNGSLYCKEIGYTDLKYLPTFDRVILIGVLHHIEDDVAREIIKIAYEALKPGGQLISVDPCYALNQNPIARYLISKDRGRNVRNLEDYKFLVESIFVKNKYEVVHRTWIPYTHCFMTCTK
jgi:cyclopropane fatty-acyl-phospholipid synthase-like methyltransferase